MRKILVTGGAGYIGSNLIKVLLGESDLEIHSLDNYFTGTEDNHIDSNNVYYHKGNTWDIEEYFKINDFDTIYHFGEYSRIVNSFEVEITS